MTHTEPSRPAPGATPLTVERLGRIMRYVVVALAAVLLIQTLLDLTAASHPDQLMFVQRDVIVRTDRPEGMQWQERGGPPAMGPERREMELETRVVPPGPNANAPRGPEMPPAAGGPERREMEFEMRVSPPGAVIEIPPLPEPPPPPEAGAPGAPVPPVPPVPGVPNIIPLPEGGTWTMTVPAPPHPPGRMMFFQSGPAGQNGAMVQAALSLAQLALGGAALWFLWTLAGNYAGGRVFGHENARLYERIGWFVLAFAAVGLLGVLVRWLTVEAAFGAGPGGLGFVAVNLWLNPHLIFAVIGGFLIMLGKVMTEGAKLAEDAALTV